MKNRIIDVVVVGLLAVGLLACSTQSIANVDAQVLADSQGLVNASKLIVASIEQNDPGAFTDDQKVKITAAENAASDAITQLSAGTSALTGALTLQQVDTNLNTVLSAVGVALPALAVAFPAIAPIVPEYDAAMVLLPIVEAWVNTTIQNTHVTSPVVAAAAAPVDPAVVAKARKVLDIPAVVQ